MDFLEVFLRAFIDYLMDITPYFLIAVLITSFLQGFTKLSWLRSILKNQNTAPVYTGLIGGLLPLCSCSMLPVANLINSLSKSYAPVLSFLVVAPIISPVTILLTYGYFGWSMTFMRIFGTMLFALLFAYTASFLVKKPKGIPMAFGNAGGSGLSSFTTHFRNNLLGIGKYLLLGIFIASLIKTLLPPSLVRPIAGSLLSYFFIAFVSVPIYVCSGEEVPIAKALRDVGFTYGNSFTFMLGGTGICMPTILATLKFLPKVLVAFYVFFWILFSIAMGIFYDMIFWKF
ncbi:MAG: permease [Aquificaceae bacterium]|nr:permease [Aquificaceae bacterium]MCX8164395.1 permease [Aquificaceae bacterium]